jgi:probable rRNA maturation factor
MTSYIDIQHTMEDKLPVNDETLTEWAMMVLSSEQSIAELTIRIVSEAEMTRLNSTYRQKHKPTNVLAFPANLPDEVDLYPPLLGDVVICPSVLEKESFQSQISVEAHWAHILMHGILHLLGYDHKGSQDTAIMQGLEITLLGRLGYANPYEE